MASGANAQVARGSDNVAGICSVAFNFDRKRVDRQQKADMRLLR